MREKNGGERAQWGKDKGVEKQKEEEAGGGRRSDEGADGQMEGREDCDSTGGEESNQGRHVLEQSHVSPGM